MKWFLQLIVWAGHSYQGQRLHCTAVILQTELFCRWEDGYSKVIPEPRAHYQPVARLRWFVGNKEPCLTSQHLTRPHPYVTYRHTSLNLLPPFECDVIHGRPNGHNVVVCITNSFSGPGSVISPVCNVPMCLDNIFQTKWALTYIFGKLVNLDLIQVKFKGQGYRSKFIVTGWKWFSFCYGCALQGDRFHRVTIWPEPDSTKFQVFLSSYNLYIIINFSITFCFCLLLENNSISWLR